MACVDLQLTGRLPGGMGRRFRDCRKVVGLTNGEDLFDVVHAVNELKSAPLVDTERAQHHVAGTSASRAEEIFGFGEEQVETGEVVGNGEDKSFAGEWMRGGRRRDQRRGFAASWEVA